MILTEACPLVVFPGVDPMNYAPCRGVLLTDAVLRGPPAHFGRDEPDETYTERDVMGLVLYAGLGRRVCVTVPRTLTLSGQVTPGVGSCGEGYRV